MKLSCTHGKQTRTEWESKMSKYYTGVGSRNTPPEICVYMTQLATTLRDAGYILRSGHARGADRAFEAGAEESAEVYLPWKSFGTKPYKDDPGTPIQGRGIVADDMTSMRHFELYKKVCENMGRSWGEFPRGVRMLTYRDMHQVIGNTEKSKPSDFLVCWTAAPGGTHYAMEAARLNYIPVFNIYDLGSLKTTLKILETVGRRNND